MRGRVRGLQRFGLQMRCAAQDLSMHLLPAAASQQLLANQPPGIAEMSQGYCMHWTAFIWQSIHLLVHISKHSVRVSSLTHQPDKDRFRRQSRGCQTQKPHPESVAAKMGLLTEAHAPITVLLCCMQLDAAEAHNSCKCWCCQKPVLPSAMHRWL